MVIRPLDDTNLVADLVAISKGDFFTAPVWGVRGPAMGPFDSPPMGSY